MTEAGQNVRQERCFLGVDGGGSKTVAVIVSADGREQGRGVASSSNHEAVGIARATTQIHAAIDAAVAMAGCQPPFGAAWIGLAGIDRAADHDLLMPHLHTLAPSVRLTNDAELALSGLDGGIGVALIAGTGSIAVGCDTHGIIRRAGGWGHILGDEGSGYDIGRQALQAATRAADGRGQPTLLLERIMRAWKLTDPSDMMERVYHGADKSRIAHLSSLAFAAARDGDAIAQTIITEAAAELALTALAVGDALDFGDIALPLALGGGLLIHEASLRQQVLDAICQRRSLGQVAIVTEPALSAARAAIDLHGS